MPFFLPVDCLVERSFTHWFLHETNILDAPEKCKGHLEVVMQMCNTSWKGLDVSLLRLSEGSALCTSGLSLSTDVQPRKMTKNKVCFPPPELKACGLTGILYKIRGSLGCEMLEVLF